MLFMLFTLLFQRKDVLVQLERARKVFTTEATEVARHMGWVKSVIFSKVKQPSIVKYFELCINFWLIQGNSDIIHISNFLLGETRRPALAGTVCASYNIIFSDHWKTIRFSAWILHRNSYILISSVVELLHALDIS